MSVWPSDYIENVVNDVEKYNGVRKTIKAGLIERCAIKAYDPRHLHPNPTDEFSQPDIGPNMGIVSNYVGTVKECMKHGLPIFEEPLIVQKMEPDGYLLLNGHHRWFAAIRMHVKKVRIQIVNLIGESDLSRMINNSSNTGLISFDLDEVLLATNDREQSPLMDTLLSRKIKERLRAGAPEVIKELKSRGYDICVYSAGYMTEDDFNDFFSMYDIQVDVVVNGINDKRNNTENTSERIKELLRNKYKRIVHIDNESVISVDHVTKGYEIYDFEEPEMSWASNVKKIAQAKL